MQVGDQVRLDDGAEVYQISAILPGEGPGFPWFHLAPAEDHPEAAEPSDDPLPWFSIDRLTLVEP